MTNDKELLELAAKAAGIDGPFAINGYAGRDGILVNNELWNPLADDGDALRLAVKLEQAAWEALPSWLRRMLNKHMGP